MPRYTIDVDDQFNKMLEDLAKSKGSTKAEVIRNAVSTYSYLQNEAPASDPSKNVSITDGQGQIVKDVILP